MIQII